MEFESWIISALHGEMATKRDLYEYWRKHAAAAEKDGRVEDVRILSNAAQRNLDDCARIQLQINALSVETRDGDGHELSESGRMSDDEYRVANSEQLRRWVERNEREDNGPARQPRGL